MSSKDERVVEMQFDNDQFEKGISTSIKSIQELKKNLNLEGAVKSLTNLERQAGRFSLSALETAAVTVADRFSTLGIIGMNVLSRITDAAINAGTAVIQHLVTPMTSGFQEYETQINAVQTILANTASKGTTLDDVNKALDDLNHYADMTIYNFTEMTRNIGTFTAAGIDLETSTAAIKGIANLAAVSGSTSQQASVAMYQLSQALASGTVKLMDWNSVVNAGMGGQVFQDALKETARVHGIAIDDMIAKEGSFRETLHKGWLTSDILTETLQKFTGDLTEEQLRSMGYAEDQIESIIKLGQTANDAATKVKTFTQLFDTLAEAAQSGWTQSWEILIGDFEEAKELLTGISDVFSDIINKHSDARNSMLEEVFGPRSNEISAAKWEEFAESGLASDEFIEAIKNTAREHGIAIDEMINDQYSFEESLKNGWLTADIIKESLGNVTDTTKAAGGSFEEYQKIVDEIWAGNWGNMNERWDALSEAGYDWRMTQDLVNLSAEKGTIVWEDLTDEQKAFFESLSSSTQILDNQANIIDINNEAVQALIESEGELTGRQKVIEGFKNIWTALTSIIERVKVAWATVFPDHTVETLSNLIDRFYEFTQTMQPSEKQLKQIQQVFVGLFSGIKIVVDIVKAVVEGFKAFFDVLPKGNTDILEFAGNIGNSITIFRHWLETSGMLGKVSEKVKKVLLDVVGFIKLFFGDLKALFTGGEVNLLWIEILKSWFGDIFNFLDNISLDGIKNFINGIKVLFSGTTFDFSWLDDLSERLSGKGTQGLEGSVSVLSHVGTALTNFFTAIKDGLSHFFSGTSFTGILDFIIKFMLSLAAFNAGGGIGNLIITFARLGDMFDDIGDSFKAITGADITAKLIKLGLALALMAWAIKQLSDIPKENLDNAIAGLVGALGTLLVGIGILEKMNLSFTFFKTGPLFAMLIGLALAILLMSKAVKNLGELDTKVLIKGIAAVAALSVIMSLFTSLTKKGGFGARQAVALVFLAAAIAIMAQIVKDLGGVDAGVLTQGVMAVAALMTIAGLFEKIVGSSKSGFGINNGTGIVLLAIAIKILSSIVKDLGGIDSNVLVKGTVAAGALMTMAAIFARVASATRFGAKNGLGLVLMAVAIKILASIAKDLGSLDLKTLAKGAGAVSILLLMTGIFEKLAGKSGFGLFDAVGLIIIANAIRMFAESVELLGHLSLKQIGKGLGTITAGLILLTAATHLAKGNVFGAAAILIIAQAMSILLSAIKGFTRVNLKTIGAAFVAIGGGLLIFMGAAALANVVGKGLIILAGAILMIGGAIALVLGSVSLFIQTWIELYNTLKNSDSEDPFGEFMQFLLDFMHSLEESAMDMGMAAFNIVANFVKGLILAALAFAGDILQAGIDLINYLMGGMDNPDQSTDEWSEGFKGELKQSLEGLKGNFQTFGETLWGWIQMGLANTGESLKVWAQSVWITIQNKVGAFVDNFRTTGAAIWSSIVTGISDFGTSLLDWAWGVQNAITAAIGDENGNITFESIGEAILNLIVGGLTSFGKLVVNFGEEFIGWITSAISGNETLQTIIGLGESILGYIVGGLTTFGNDITGFGETFIQNIQTSFAGWDGSLTGLGQGISTLIASTLGLPDDWTAADFISALSGKFVDLVTSIGNIGKQIATDIMSAFGFGPDQIESAQGFIDGLTQYISLPIKWAGAGASILGGIFDTLTASDKPFDEKATDIAGMLSDAFVKAITDLNEIGKQILAGIMGVFGFGPDEVEKAQTFIDGITEFLTSPNKWIEVGKQLLDNIKNAIYNAFLGAIASAVEGLKSIGAWDALADFLDWIGQTELRVKLENLAFEIDQEEANRRFQEHIPEMTFSEATGYANLTTTLEVTPSYDFISTGHEMHAAGFGDINDYAAGAKEAQAGLENTLSDIGENGAEKFEDAVHTGMGNGSPSWKAEANIMWYAMGMLLGAAKNISTVVRAAEILAKPFENQRSKMSSIGTQLSRAVASGFQSSSYALSSSAYQAAVRGASGASSAYNDYYQAGIYVMRGLANGMANNAYIVSSAARQAASSALSAAKASLGIASPSKEFELIGMFSDMGMAQGFLKYSGLVADSAIEVGDSAMDTLRYTLSNMADIINGEVETSPVIRPVLDLSQVQASNALLGSMFNGRGSYLARQAGMSFAYGNLQNTNQYYADSTTAAIYELGDRIDTLASQMNNLQVVMDGGALVGQIKGTMNNRLGQMAARSGRGI